MISLYDTTEVEKRIKEALPIIIDELVGLYGEEHRATIQERIDSTNLFIYNAPFVVKQIAKKDLKNDDLSVDERARISGILSTAEAEIEQRKCIDEEITKLFLAEISKKYPQMINNDNVSDLVHSSKKHLYCFGIETAGYIAAFSKEKVDELNSSNSNSLQKLMIRDKQIAYLKSKGINITLSNYDEVIQSEECKQAIPSEQEISEIETLRGDFEKEYYKRIVERVPTYSNAWKTSLGVDTRSYKDIVSSIDNGLNCNACYVNDDKISNTLVLSIQGLLEGYRDVALIHEIVHAVELNVGNDGVARCGLQSFELGQHTALNEAKTQHIAMRIASKLQQRGVYFFESPEVAKVSGGTSYEREGKFVEVFMDKFEKEILDVGMTGDMEGFLNKIGKKNFEKFSNAVDEHSKISIYQHISARDSKDPNHPIKRKKDEIFRKVRETIQNMEHEAFGTHGSMER